jgi:hypothetical protein
MCFIFDPRRSPLRQATADALKEIAAAYSMWISLADD